MGFKLCFLVMNVRPEAQPRRALCEAIPNLLERWEAEFFSPRALYLWLDGGEAIELARLDAARSVRTQPLWQDEVMEDGQSLTRCSPAQGSSLIAEAAALLTERQPRSLYLRAEGALHHRAIGDTQPHWYGRWMIQEPPTLSELIEIRLEWTAQRRSLELSFHLSGYPLTSVTPLPSGNLGAGDSEMAAANRALIIPALAYAPLSFGLLPDEVRWIDDGDYAGLYPEDATSLREYWLPRLASGELIGNSQAERSGSEAAPSAEQRQMTEQDVQFYLNTLQRGTRDDRAFALQELARSPSGDRRIRDALIPLLYDTTPCLLQIPYRFGELRLLAGAALAAERWAAGDKRAVRLRCIAPVTSDDLEKLQAAAGLTPPPYAGNPIEHQLNLFALLREHGLPEVELELRHPVHLGWIATGQEEAR